MANKYKIELKAQVTHEICVEKKSTSKIADHYNIPRKTVEKWVTQYNKNPNAFSRDIISETERVHLLEKEIKELRKANEILKKTLRLIAKNE